MYDPPDSWYEPDYGYTPECRCIKCEDKEDKLNRSSEYLAEIIAMLYGKKPLKITDLEHNLDQLCYLLDVNPIVDDIQIERKRESKVLHPFPAVGY